MISHNIIQYNIIEDNVIRGDSDSGDASADDGGHDDFVVSLCVNRQGRLQLFVMTSVTR